MASKVTVDIPVAAITEEFRTITDTQQQRVAEYIATTTRKNLNAVVGKKTGNLYRSVKAMRSLFNPHHWIATVQAPHAHLIEYGHYIVPRMKSKFYTKVYRKAGGPIRKIGHVPGKFFFTSAVAMAWNNIDRILDVDFHIYVNKGIYTKGYKA